MRSLARRSGLLLLGCAMALAQKPAFEVVSIKPAPPPDGHGMRMGHSGGPGTPDPGRWSTENWTIQSLVTSAYGIQWYQYSGPSWTNELRFNIEAKVPPGATKNDLKVMIQGLLEERFKLQFHREKKEMTMYDLVVGKNGPKLKPAVEEPPPPEDAEKPRTPSGPLKLAADGYPDLPKGFTMAWMKGRARWQDPKGTMKTLADVLSGQLGKPVNDLTGLTGKYDMTMFWAAESRDPEAEPGPTIFSALQDQLGLKLEQKKGMIEMLVVDKAEKVPTDN